MYQPKQLCSLLINAYFLITFITLQVDYYMEKLHIESCFTVCIYNKGMQLNLSVYIHTYCMDLVSRKVSEL